MVSYISSAYSSLSLHHPGATFSQGKFLAGPIVVRAWRDGLTSSPIELMTDAGNSRQSVPSEIDTRLTRPLQVSCPRSYVGERRRSQARGIKPKRS